MAAQAARDAHQHAALQHAFQAAERQWFSNPCARMRAPARALFRRPSRFGERPKCGKFRKRK
jgi:hypothetical protein